MFAGSRLPLTTWFAAIRAYAADASISPRQLQNLVGITRPATARSILQRIRAAVSENNVDPALAGLLTFQSEPPAKCPPP
jgi:hypothetical protein